MGFGTALCRGPFLPSFGPSTRRARRFLLVEQKRPVWPCRWRIGGYVIQSGEIVLHDTAPALLRSGCRAQVVSGGEVTMPSLSRKGGV